MTKLFKLTITLLLALTLVLEGGARVKKLVVIDPQVAQVTLVVR